MVAMERSACCISRSYMTLKLSLSDWCKGLCRLPVAVGSRSLAPTLLFLRLVHVLEQLEEPCSSPGRRA